MNAIGLRAAIALRSARVALKHALLPERFRRQEYLIEAERQERPQVRLVFVECERCA